MSDKIRSKISHSDDRLHLLCSAIIMVTVITVYTQMPTMHTERAEQTLLTQDFEHVVVVVVVRRWSCIIMSRQNLVAR